MTSITTPVPYSSVNISEALAAARGATQTYHHLVETLNGTEQGRQLIPLLADGMSGEYLLGYSHNPWGASSGAREVLEHLNAT